MLKILVSSLIIYFIQVEFSFSVNVFSKIIMSITLHPILYNDVMN